MTSSAAAAAAETTHDMMTLQSMCARRSLTWLQATGYCLLTSRLCTTLMTSSTRAGYVCVIITCDARLSARIHNNTHRLAYSNLAFSRFAKSRKFLCETQWKFRNHLTNVQSPSANNITHAAFRYFKYQHTGHTEEIMPANRKNGNRLSLFQPVLYDLNFRSFVNLSQFLVGVDSKQCVKRL